MRVAAVVVFALGIEGTLDIFQAVDKAGIQDVFS
jgi:hypothetical protein